VFQLEVVDCNLKIHFQFRALPVILGFGSGVLLDSYIRIPNIREKILLAKTEAENFTK
jgi:hypothetical protein